MWEISGKGRKKNLLESCLRWKQHKEKQKLLKTQQGHETLEGEIKEKWTKSFQKIADS